MSENQRNIKWAQFENVYKNLIKEFKKSYPDEYVEGDYSVSLVLWTDGDFEMSIMTTASCVSVVPDTLKLKIQGEDIELIAGGALDMTVQRMVKYKNSMRKLYNEQSASMDYELEGPDEDVVDE